MCPSVAAASYAALFVVAELALPFLSTSPSKKKPTSANLRRYFSKKIPNRQRSWRKERKRLLA
jgi:hypothetical protein